MKFAVKTITCLGCKTPLRANNGIKSTFNCTTIICIHRALLQMALYVTTVGLKLANYSRSR